MCAPVLPGRDPPRWLVLVLPRRARTWASRSRKGEDSGYPSQVVLELGLAPPRRAKPTHIHTQHTHTHSTHVHTCMCMQTSDRGEPLSHTAPPSSFHLKLTPWHFHTWAVMQHHHGLVLGHCCPRVSSEITLEVILCKYSRQQCRPAHSWLRRGARARE